MVPLSARPPTSFFARKKLAPRICGRAVTRALASDQYFKSIEISIVCRISDNNFTKLRISRAYVNLMSLPEGDVRMISLAWIGNYEIRMLEASPASSVDEPLFLIELFDHDELTSVDVRVCYEIEDGATAFEAFISR